MSPPPAAQAVAVAALLLGLSGCVEYATLDLDSAAESASELPNFPGPASQTYGVLLVHADDEAPAWDDVLEWMLLDCRAGDPQFYTPPPIVTPRPYRAEVGCGPPLGSWGEGKLFLSSVKFAAAKAATVVLDGQGAACCTRASYLEPGIAKPLTLGGRNFTVEPVEGGAYRITAQGFDPATLGAGRVLDFRFRTTSGYGFLVRFDHPGTWLRERVRDPHEDWVACIEPPGRLCHRDWGGVPPPEFWKNHTGSRSVSTVSYMDLDANAPTLSAFLDPLLRMPGWGDPSFNRFEMETRDGRPTNLTLVLRHGYNRSTITHEPGGAGHLFRVRIVNTTGQYEPSIGQLGVEVHRFDDLTFLDLQFKADLGAKLHLEVKDMPQYGYEWTYEVTARAAGGTPSRPHLWTRSTEPDGTAWRIIHNPCCVSGTKTPALVASKVEGTGIEYSVFRPRDPIPPAA